MKNLILMIRTKAYRLTDQQIADGIDDFESGRRKLHCSLIAGRPVNIGPIIVAVYRRVLDERSTAQNSGKRKKPVAGRSRPS